MRIHHFTIPATNTELVASALAELFGGKIIPVGHPTGSLIVYAGDADGSCIEVWPASTRADVGNHRTEQRDVPLPSGWPHHAYVTTEHASTEQILAMFERHGWKADKVKNGPPNGPGFELVRGWIENQTVIELGGADMRAQYEAFFAAAMASGRS